MTLTAFPMCCNDTSNGDGLKNGLRFGCLNACFASNGCVSLPALLFCLLLAVTPFVLVDYGICEDLIVVVPKLTVYKQHFWKGFFACILLRRVSGRSQSCLRRCFHQLRLQFEGALFACWFSFRGEWCRFFHTAKEVEGTVQSFFSKCSCI